MIQPLSDINLPLDAGAVLDRFLEELRKDIVAAYRAGDMAEMLRMIGYYEYLNRLTKDHPQISQMPQIGLPNTSA